MFNKTTLQSKRFYKEFVFDGIGKEKDVITENTIKGFILGNTDFAEKITERFIIGKQDS